MRDRLVSEELFADDRHRRPLDIRGHRVGSDSMPSWRPLAPYRADGGDADYLRDGRVIGAVFVSVPPGRGDEEESLASADAGGCPAR
jgi:hypothetical protein